VSGNDCHYDPFASKQTTSCGQVLEKLTAKGVPYSIAPADALNVTIGGTPVADPLQGEALPEAITAAGYDLTPQTPPIGNLLVVLLGVIALSFLSGMTYGPVAAALSEMFPPAVRYSSMSIPYHIGCGYFGGFLPFIASYIVAKTGDPYSGLWYTLGVVVIALLAILWGEGRSWQKDVGGAAAPN
jgi:MFS family permease